MTEQRMSNAEAVMLCRMAKAACPQQQFDQYTPDMWHELLGDLRFGDAREALVEVVKSQPFVSPAEIRDHVKKVRGDRIRAYGSILPPFELEGNPAAENAWIREMVRRIGDGDVLPGEEPTTDELLARTMPDWNRMLPAPRPMTAVEIAAHGAQKPDRRKAPGYKEALEKARAELDAKRAELTDAEADS